MYNCFFIQSSEKARFIAKTGIVDNQPCGGVGCAPPSEVTFNYFPDKVFPEEVDNIKDFMTDAFSTNVNGFVTNMEDNYERESVGKINVKPMSNYENLNGSYGDNNTSDDIDSSDVIENEKELEKILGKTESGEKIDNKSEYKGNKEIKSKVQIISGDHSKVADNNKPIQQNTHNFKNLRKIR